MRAAVRAKTGAIMNSMNAPPNWYPDPSSEGLVRWWDGGRWTEHTQQARPVAPTAPRPGGNSYAAAWWIGGIAFALLVLVGVVLLITVVTAIVPLGSDFFETWQGVYCGETQQCDG